LPWLILGDFNTSPQDDADHEAMAIPYLIDVEHAVSAYPLDGSVFTTAKSRRAAGQAGRSC